MRAKEVKGPPKRIKDQHPIDAGIVPEMHMRTYVSNISMRIHALVEWGEYATSKTRTYAVGGSKTSQHINLQTQHENSRRQ